MFGLIPFGINLEENCIETELHKVLVKTLLARKALINKYKSKPFHEWGISYFDARRDDVLIENNYIYRMISEHKNFRIRKGSKFPFEEFVVHFNEHFRGQPNRLLICGLSQKAYGLEIYWPGPYCP